MKHFVLAASLAFAGFASAQDKPVEIAKKDLPAMAQCATCVALGTMLTEAKPTGGVMFRGKPYYFHSKEMEAQFKKDPDAYADPVLPRPMPRFALKDTTGMLWDESCFKGKTVLIDFWATWCEPCKQMVPILDSIWKENKDKGLVFLSVSVDQKRKDFDSFVKATPFPNPTLLDDKKTFQAWHVLAIPAIYLVKDGHIVAQWSGVVERTTIEKALKG